MTDNKNKPISYEDILKNSKAVNTTLPEELKKIANKDKRKLPFEGEFDTPDNEANDFNYEQTDFNNKENEF